MTRLTQRQACWHQRLRGVNQTPDRPGLPPVGYVPANYCRIPRGHGIRGDIPAHHRTCPDHRAIPNGHALQDDRPGANEDMVADLDWPCRGCSDGRRHRSTYGSPNRGSGLTRRTRSARRLLFRILIRDLAPILEPAPMLTVAGSSAVPITARWVPLPTAEPSPADIEPCLTVNFVSRSTRAPGTPTAMARSRFSTLRAFPHRPIPPACSWLPAVLLGESLCVRSALYSSATAWGSRPTKVPSATPQSSALVASGFWYSTVDFKTRSPNCMRPRISDPRLDRREPPILLVIATTQLPLPRRAVVQLVRG